MGAWFCGSCLFGRVSSRQKSFPNNDGDMFNGSCVIHAVSVCLAVWWIPQMLRRSVVREKFGISGGGCSDCLVSTFCAPCSMSQMNMELKSRAATSASIHMEGYPREQQRMLYDDNLPPYNDSSSANRPQPSSQPQDIQGKPEIRKD